MVDHDANKNSGARIWHPTFRGLVLVDAVDTPMDERTHAKTLSCNDAASILRLHSIAYHEPYITHQMQETPQMTSSAIALNDEFKDACITKLGLLDMQVCVPSHWTDDGIIRFAEYYNPCGTERGWQIRKQGSKYLSGADERVQCSKYANNVHIMLDA